MNILVYGAGAIGSTFGGFLSRSGHQVTLVGRSWHLRAVQNHGLRVTGIWGHHRFKNLSLASNPAVLKKQKEKFDLILLTVKSFDTFCACRELKRLINPSAPILLLQNGFGNIEQACRIFPKSQILAGRVIFGVELRPGAVKITVWGGDVLIGEVSSMQISRRATEIASMFTKSGIQSRAIRNIRQHIWAKVIYNASLNPLASLLNTHYGSLLQSDATRSLMRAIVRECYQVARLTDDVLEPKSAERYVNWLFKRLIPDTYHHHPSMLADLKRGKKTEIDALNGAVMQMAQKFGISVPVNELLTRLIKKRELEARGLND